MKPGADLTRYYMQVNVYPLRSLTLLERSYLILARWVARELAPVRDAQNTRTGRPLWYFLMTSPTFHVNDRSNRKSLPFLALFGSGEEGDGKVCLNGVREGWRRAGGGAVSTRTTTAWTPLAEAQECHHPNNINLHNPPPPPCHPRVLSDRWQA